MPIEDAVYNVLSNASGLTAMVSTRIYPQVAPQDVSLPFVIYTRLGTDHVEDLGNSVGVARGNFQIDTWSTKYNEARDVAEQLRLAFQDYSGTAASVKIVGVVLTDDRDIFEPPRGAEEPGYHSVQSTFGVWFQEAIPT